MTEEITMKAYVYVTAANGMEVRIPKDKYPQWKAAQDKLKAGEKLPESQTRKQLVSLMKGEK
jgi:hypothetical protein